MVRSRRPFSALDCSARFHTASRSPCSVPCAHQPMCQASANRGRAHTPLLPTPHTGVSHTTHRSHRICPRTSPCVRSQRPLRRHHTIQGLLLASSFSLPQASISECPAAGWTFRTQNRDSRETGNAFAATCSAGPSSPG
eukprot:877393-Prymnesium_polylepis.2